MCASDCKHEEGCRCRGGLLRGFIQPRLLFLLAQRSAHGYELMDTLNKTENLPSADAGNLYRILSKLEEHGFVRSQWDVGESGPARKVYALTETGRRNLDGWVTDLQKTRNKLDEFISEYEKFLLTERETNEPQT